MTEWTPDALDAGVSAIARIYREAGQAMTTDELIDEVIEREGGYTNNPADRGGPTNMGITEQVARAHGYAGDMRDLPRSTAEAIYKARYWTGPRFDQVAARYPKLAEALFDAGVNHGPARAVGWLQRALNVLNRGASDYPDIATDGGIGPMTLHALDGYRQRRGDGHGELVLMMTFMELRGAFYVTLAETSPSQEVFEPGWQDRNLGLIRELLA